MENMLRVWEEVEQKSNELTEKKEEDWQWIDVEDIEDTGCMTSRVNNEGSNGITENILNLTLFTLLTVLYINGDF